MKRTILLTVCLLVACFSFASERSESEMRQAAMQVLNDGRLTLPGSNRTPSALKLVKDMSQLAIYGYEGGGFAVVSRDDRFNAVIGYSESQFQDTDMPCGFKWWLESVNKVMEQTNGQTPVFSQVRKSKTSVAPILSTKWGQGNPFNALLHYSIGGESYEFITGCVATAMAQVMNYYRYPDKGIGSVSYVVWNYMATMEHEFGDYYDWDNMLNEYNYQEWGSMRTTTKAVATLMRDCGMAVEMNYGTSSQGSGASSTKIAPALKEHFLYKDGTTFYERSDYSKSKWMQMIYDELSAGHPIIYGGEDWQDAENPSGPLLSTKIR